MDMCLPLKQVFWAPCRHENKKRTRQKGTLQLISGNYEVCTALQSSHLFVYSRDEPLLVPTSDL